MAGAYPDPPGPRIAVERKTVVYYQATDVTPIPLNTAAKETLADEDYSVFALQPAFGGAVWYISVLFDNPMTVQGYAALAEAGGTWDRIEYSTDTTDGLDGTWTIIDASPGGAHNGTTMNYRTDWDTVLIPVNNAKGFRIRRSGGGTGVYTLHLYGHSTTFTDRKLEFWHPTLDTYLGGAGFDFGDCPHDSSADKVFRVKNTWSGSEPATNVVVGNAMLIDTGSDPYVVNTFLYSVDGGNTFRGTCYIGDLSPGQISRQIIMRRVTPAWVTSGPWCGGMFVDSIGGTFITGEHGWYMGDVSNNVPIPHIWYMTPSAQFREELIEVVGYGFGISEVDLNGVCKLGPGAMTVDTWHRDPPTADGYTVDRKIDATVNLCDTFCDRVVVVVPNNAFDDYVTVETDA